MSIDRNDPRLTAYVLNELSDADRAEVEAALDGSPELRQTVDEIRQTTDLLADRLPSEPYPSLSDDQRAPILADHAPATRQSESSQSRWISIAVAVSLLFVIVGTAAIGSIWSGLAWREVANDVSLRGGVTQSRKRSAEDLEGYGDKLRDSAPIDSPRQHDDDPSKVGPGNVHDGSALPAGKPGQQNGTGRDGEPRNPNSQLPAPDAKSEGSGSKNSGGDEGQGKGDGQGRPRDSGEGDRPAQRRRQAGQPEW